MSGGHAWMDGLRAHPHGAVHADAPCQTCGTLTSRRAVVGVRLSNPISSEMNLTPELVPVCDACEAQRVAKQRARIAANPNVLPHLRAEAA
jgi:hypothetical protein